MNLVITDTKRPLLVVKFLREMYPNTDLRMLMDQVRQLPLTIRNPEYFFGEGLNKRIKQLEETVYSLAPDEFDEALSKQKNDFTLFQKKYETAVKWRDSLPSEQQEYVKLLTYSSPVG